MSVQAVPASLGRDGVEVEEGLAIEGITDPFALGTNGIRSVYYGDDPETWLLSALDTLEGRGFEVYEYHCYKNQDRGELFARRGDVLKTGIIDVSIDLFIPVKDDAGARVQTESRDSYTTARDGSLTWGRRVRRGESKHTDERPDPVDGGTGGRADADRSGTGSPADDHCLPVGQSLPDTDADR